MRLDYRNTPLVRAECFFSQKFSVGVQILSTPDLVHLRFDKCRPRVTVRRENSFMRLKFPPNSLPPRKMLPPRGKFPGFVLFLGALFFVNLRDEFSASGLRSSVHVASHIIRADATFERSTRVIVACWVPCINSTVIY